MKVILRLTIDDSLVSGMSQCRIGDTPYFLHYHSGPTNVDDQLVYQVVCVAAANGDHGRPRLEEGSREWEVAWGEPFNPVFFSVRSPDNLTHARCYLLRDDAASDSLERAVELEAIEREPDAMRWNWGEWPF